MPVSAVYVTLSPSMVTVLVMMTGLCEASGRAPSSSLAAGALLVAAGAFVTATSAAAMAADRAAARNKLQRYLFNIFGTAMTAVKIRLRT